MIGVFVLTALITLGVIGVFLLAFLKKRKTFRQQRLLYDPFDRTSGISPVNSPTTIIHTPMNAFDENPFDEKAFDEKVFVTQNLGPTFPSNAFWPQHKRNPSIDSFSGGSVDSFFGGSTLTPHPF